MDFGQTIETYSVEGQPQTRQNRHNPEFGICAWVEYSQSRTLITREASVDSLDLILGLLGGYLTILLGVQQIFFTRYNEFKFNNSVIGNMYSATPDASALDFADSMNEAENSVKHEVQH